MPYIATARQEVLSKNTKAASNEGEWNWLYSMAMLAIWKNHRNYSILHKIRSFILKDQGIEKTPDLKKIKDVDNQLITIGVRATDRQAAKEMAFLEFYRRIGVAYESTKIEQNGDIYADEIKWIKEMK